MRGVGADTPTCPLTPLSPGGPRMIVTLIIPFDDGFVDIDGHVSGGIRTITGKLTEQQLEELLVEPAYAGRAIQRKYTLNGEFVSLRVTFNNDNVTPDHVLSS